MHRHFISRAIFALAAIALTLPLIFTAPVFAQGAAKGASGLPLPRFVSLKATRVNLRVGPGLDYAVAWLYTRAGTPMEVIQEYGHWRRVRDADGTEGWVYQSLLSGQRTAMAAPWKRSAAPLPAYIDMHAEPRASADIVARLEPGVVVTMHACNGDWCEADANGVKGWIAQNQVWGAYPGEAFKD